MDGSATLTSKGDGMDKTTDLLIGFVIGGFALLTVALIIVNEYILPWRDAKKRKNEKTGGGYG